LYESDDLWFLAFVRVVADEVLERREEALKDAGR
jgi:hypothetical protein